jgi:hypothetical protein
MSFISSFFFVFYLQVMPPPPPTIYGGGDYWAGRTNTRKNGKPAELNWTSGELGAAIQGRDSFKIGGYKGTNQVVTAIERGWLTDLDYWDWFTLLINTITRNGPNSSVHLRACVQARNSDVANIDQLATSFRCPANAPIPVELTFLTIFSFLVILLFYSKETLNYKELFTIDRLSRLLELLSIKELQVFIPFSSYKKLCKFVKSLTRTPNFIKITAVPRA